ncbi:hypothetical protein, partial [Candidatus Entotheonella palauensis]|uniref:hypothetical protein n=1 Tax=Candidatus Entotheonella palauensis TaxID=93172 RepID=UPI001C4E0E3D
MQSRQIGLSLAALAPSLAADAPLLIDLLGLPGAREDEPVMAPDARKQRLQEASNSRSVLISLYDLCRKAL